jgi:hypothetical protein
MAVAGRKQLTYPERIKLFRSKPKEVRFYDNEMINSYQPLIESFTKDDYQTYEKLFHAYKRVSPMLKYCGHRGITGPVLELATIRSQDLKLHQKLVQILRHRWTNRYEEQKSNFNATPHRFWNHMAGSIQRRCKEEQMELHSEWEGKEGRELLIDFLITQYEKQKGLCAVSHEPMTLTTGTRHKNGNKCSPDRKNSNKGYTPDNLWFVTWWVNAMKMDMAMITFWKRIDVLAESRKTRKEEYASKARY